MHHNIYSAMLNTQADFGIQETKVVVDSIVILFRIFTCKSHSTKCAMDC